jgi:hypothetical protein
MSITLIIDGNQVDFESTFKRLFKEMMAENQCTAPATSPDFVIDPNHTYMLSDERVQKLFGVTNHKFPVRGIITELRKYGITPIAKQRTGAKVFGSQILQYLKSLKEQQSDYNHKN